MDSPWCVCPPNTFSTFPHLQTFAITDVVAQRKEIDGICLFFVLVGVVSFFTQMLQVE